MNEQLRTWRPTADEVERIVAEMRPIIRAFARRDRARGYGRRGSITEERLALPR